MFAVSLIFFDSHNKLFFLAIFIGIILKNIYCIFKNKIKFDYNIILVLLIELFKIFLLKTSPIVLIFSSLFGLFLLLFKNNLIKNKILFVFYLFLPLSSIYFYKYYYQNGKESYIYVLLTTIYIIINCRINMLSLSIRSVLGFISILIICTYLETLDKYDIKKRNIIMIFLTLLLLIYYNYIS